MSRVIPPGSVVGVLGSGQLGRMFAIAARRMGYRVHTYSPESDTPTGQVADVEITAPYEDLEMIRAFASGVDVITYEFENVPADCVKEVDHLIPARPSRHALHICQNRLREKKFLGSHGFPVTPYRDIPSLDALTRALTELGTPAVLKTAASGYDGKGQTLLNGPAEAPAAFDALKGQPALLEPRVDFACELSVVAVRSVTGATAHWGAIENTHDQHILDVSMSPPVTASPAQSAEAVDITLAVMEQLDVVGVLCVEFFLTKAGALWINELAPRPHNSGHFTIDASVTCQFESQLRAVCGLPLGDTTLFGPAAMANLLGEHLIPMPPRYARALEFPGVKLHMYGKTEARCGRKLGHITALGPDPERAAGIVRQARRAMAEY